MKMQLVVANAILLAFATPLVGAHNDVTPNPLTTLFDGHGTDGSNRVAGYYYADASVLVGHTGPDIDPSTGTSFAVGSAWLLCDRETIDGRPLNPYSEPEIDGVQNPPSLGLTLFNDGGIGGVCHTHKGFYLNPPYNTPGCNYSPAWADDATTLRVWITTSCDYAHAVSGPALVGYLVTCLGGVPPYLAFDLLTCADTVADCVTGAVLNCALTSGYACGADAEGTGGLATPGQSGWGDYGVAFDSVPSPCNDSDGAAAVAVWTAVFVDSIAVSLELSMPAFGWIG